MCRALKRGQAPPYVILVTALHGAAASPGGKGCDADDLLVKPIDFEEL